MTGLCECGCGAPTRIATRAESRWGTRRGEPRRFVKGHATRTPVTDRFWCHVIKNDEPDACWLWLAARDKNGYGYTSVNRKHVKAHRVAWELTNGLVPAGLFVLHKCDRPQCVNPTHLFLGTQIDNMQDAARKGRIRVPGLRGDAHPNAQLTTDQVLAIYQRTKSTESHGSIAIDFGTSRDNVWRIANKKCWIHVIGDLP